MVHSAHGTADDPSYIGVANAPGGLMAAPNAEARETTAEAGRGERRGDTRPREDDAAALLAIERRAATKMQGTN